MVPQQRAFELQLNGRSQSYQNTYVVNDSTTIVCNVVNNTAAETLIWYRGTQQLDVDSKNSENSSTICLPALSPQDDGVSFTCLLKRNTTMKLSVQLSVTYDPILKGNTIIEGEEGKTIKMTCEFMANPAAVMSWRRNNSVVNFPARFEQQMTRDSMTLTITKAEKSDSDNYTCVAQVGNKETELVFELVVGDRIPGLPIEAIAAAVVVGALIIAFALFARRDQIFKGDQPLRTTEYMMCNQPLNGRNDKTSLSLQKHTFTSILSLLKLSSNWK
ncbi:transmembrane and immunoglobulin domain-containing protein 1 [Gastrophryne carolinensis]